MTLDLSGFSSAAAHCSTFLLSSAKRRAQGESVNLLSESREGMEDYDYSTVSLDRYWSWVGIPYFLFVIGFGLFVLFKVTGTGTYAGPSQIKAVISDILGHPVGAGPSAGAAKPTPNAANVGKAGKNVPQANLLGIDPSLPKPPP
jgi:hypothetical protein